MIKILCSNCRTLLNTYSIEKGKPLKSLEELLPYNYCPKCGSKLSKTPKRIVIK